MKNLIFAILSTTTLLLSCSPDNPNPNGNGGQTYTQGTPVTDIDGNTYPTIISDCGQTWTAKNLNVSKYRNGDVIPQVTDPTQWANLTTGAWCYYNNDPTNEIIYGKLYNWYAVNDPRGLAPTGWHIPSNSEWNKFVKFLDAGADTSFYEQSTTAGGAMKNPTGWDATNVGASNSSGFTGIPGGYRIANGPYSGIGLNAYWWSSTENTNSSTGAWFRMLFNTNSTIRSVSFDKIFAFSVRCIKD